MSPFLGFLFIMKTIIFEGVEFKRYLETDIYSDERGKIISANFRNTKEIGVFKQSPARGGYLRITTCFKGKVTGILSHRVIAICWLDNPENKTQVNHINGIKDDNRKVNLEWNTPKENTNHSIRTGLQIRHKGEDCFHYGKRGAETNRSKKVLDTETGKVYDCLKDAQKDSKFSYKYLSRQLTGDRKNLTNLKYI